MQSNIYFISALIACTTATQLSAGPSISKETIQSSDSPKSSSKRYAIQAIILYLTPSEIKAMHAAQTSEETKSSIENQKESNQMPQNNNEQQQQTWSQYSKSLEADQANHQPMDLYYPKPSPVFENQGDKIDTQHFYFEQSIKEQQHQLENQKPREHQPTEWVPLNPVESKNQEETLIHEQLQQHWNRILNHNRAQLKGLSTIGNDNPKPEASNENEKPAERWQLSAGNQDQKKTDVERQIEFVLKQSSNFDKQNNPTEIESINQRPPMVIQKEIRLIKHHPVPVVKKVKVAVHRPVLVPVPEPYEVKVPHPYPVPFEVVKHIPVPVFRSK